MRMLLLRPPHHCRPLPWELPPWEENCGPHYLAADCTVRRYSPADLQSPVSALSAGFQDPAADLLAEFQNPVSAL